jgi:signal transduction histidine kinase
MPPPLHALLAARRTELIEQFLDALRGEGLVSGSGRRIELLEDVSFFLADVEDALREADTHGSGIFAAARSAAAHEHGTRRQGLGVDLACLLREYAILRRTIVRFAEEAGAPATPRELDVLSSCIEDAMRDAANAHVRARDAQITENQRALEVERERLRRALRSREEVLGIVSHDLRTPLAAILLDLEQIRRIAKGFARSPESAARFDGVVAAMGRAARRMDALIGDLLAISTIEEGRLRIDVEPVDLEDLVGEAIEGVRAIAAHAEIELELSAVPAMTLACDRLRLLQVLSNLLGNAVKFTPAGGRVRVSVIRDVDHVEILVSDTGPGIAATDLSHVFDRFWQAPGRARSGAGLGLAIAKGIVEAHDGRIEVESEEGRGTTFRVRLPCGPR